MRRIRMIILIVAAALTIPLGAAQRDNRAEAQLQAAITKETVEGDLKGAIEQYKKLASGSNRAVAARALVRMGECYEKLGDAEARKVYERVVREFPDQKEALAEAQQHLATKAVQADVGIVMQRIAVFPDRRSYTSMSHDGRCLTFIKADGIYVHDLAKSEERRIVPKASQEDSVLIANIFPDGRERERDF